MLAPTRIIDGSYPLSRLELWSNATHILTSVGGARGSPAAAWMLLGMVVIIMSMFYLVNSPSSSIRDVTWRTLSGTLSIFCSVLIFHSIKEMDRSCWRYATFFYYDESVWLDDRFFFDLISYGRLVAYYFVFQFVLLKLKERPHGLHGWGHIGEHIGGFMAADIFSNMQEEEPWNRNLISDAQVVVIAVAALSLLMSLGRRMRSVILDAQQIVELDEDGNEVESVKNWKHQCYHAEENILSFALGLTFTQLCRFYLVGKVPHAHGIQQTDDPRHIWSIFCFAGACLLIMVVADIAKRLFFQRFSHYFSTISGIMAMTMAWSLFYGGKWLFWHATAGEGLLHSGKDVMIAFMVQAVLFSIVSTSAIIGCDCMLRITPFFTCLLEQTTESLVLLIGLSWEAAFQHAIFLAVHAEGGGSDLEEYLSTIAVSFSLCGLVIPAWILYIVPRAMHHHAHEKRTTEKGELDHEDKKSNETHEAAAVHGNGSHG